MKNVLIAIGVLILIVAIVKGGGYLMDYEALSKYGKGYVWGNIGLGIIGMLLIYVGSKKKKKDLL